MCKDDIALISDQLECGPFSRHGSTRLVQDESGKYCSLLYPKLILKPGYLSTNYTYLVLETDRLHPEFGQINNRHFSSCNYFVAVQILKYWTFVLF